MSLRVLSASDVERIQIPSHALLELMRTVFTHVSDNKGIDAPHRTSISTRHHKVLFMPSRLSSIGTTVKVVSVPGPNVSGGLPASTLLLDEETGAVRAVVNARSLTALRTAAGSLLATTLLVYREVSEIVAFGAGAQILAHLRLFLAHYPTITNCTIVNRSMNDRAQKTELILRAEFPSVRIYATADRGDCLKTADIVVCATSATSPLFANHELAKRDAHVVLVGSYTPEMHEVDTALIRRASTVVVDSREACLIEAGELLSAGSKANHMMEVGELVSGSKGLGTPGGLTVFKSVGIGVQDVAITAAVVQRAIESGIGIEIENFD